MEETIRSHLQAIEAEENVRILYACESGSRAWGFASPDSDYDVRFLYLRSLKWYLSIEEKRDVIESPINEQLDINGWDLHKALKLLRKSNPPLLEWLSSPIVYLENGSIPSQLRDLAPDYYSPAACAYHYLHMAQSNHAAHLTGEQPSLKKYFYSLRPLLACPPLDRARPGHRPHPVPRSARHPHPTLPLRADIEALLYTKTRTNESERGPRVPSISHFIETELARFKPLPSPTPSPQPPPNPSTTSSAPPSSRHQLDITDLTCNIPR